MSSHNDTASGTMSYLDLFQMLIEAEDRAANFADAGVRERSEETASLIKQRMASEGLSRDRLRTLAVDDFNALPGRGSLPDWLRG
uniref:hypothetical protein n=1 Tax=Burkholderia sp. M701 TaxID=326454 RepID=UPI0012EB8B6E|nr:hypothetical protein [Burkholderia sp. M701]